MDFRGGGWGGNSVKSNSFCAVNVKLWSALPACAQLSSQVSSCKASRRQQSAEIKGKMLQLRNNKHERARALWYDWILPRWERERSRLLSLSRLQLPPVVGFVFEVVAHFRRVRFPTLKLYHTLNSRETVQPSVCLHTRGFVPETKQFLES